MLRAIDRFVDLGDLWAHMASFYSPLGRPSVDPELLIRMLIVGYCSKNRHGRFRDSELLRRLFEQVVCRCIDEGWSAARALRWTPA